jgi:hypothetical protein
MSVKQPRTRKFMAHEPGLGVQPGLKRPWYRYR